MSSGFGPMAMGGGGSGHWIDVSETWYYYTDVGNVGYVVTNLEETTQVDPNNGNVTKFYTATRFGYARNKQAATFALGESWHRTNDWNPQGYTMDYAREFRYDGARQRYLNRELDTGDLDNSQLVSISETWSDYAGNSVYGDYTVEQDYGQPLPDPSCGSKRQPHSEHRGSVCPRRS